MSPRDRAFLYFKNDGGADEPEPLFIWGFHQLWHGPMSKARINAISTTRPIVVWHRSFHELYMNDAAMAMAGVNIDDIKPSDQIDIDNGHFFENGLGRGYQHQYSLRSTSLGIALPLL